MSFSISGKTAIVTGAASGFGAGIARKFATEGAQVMVVDIDHDGALAMAWTAIDLLADSRAIDKVRSEFERPRIGEPC